MEGHLLLFIDVVERNTLLVGLVFIPDKGSSFMGKGPPAS